MSRIDSMEDLERAFPVPKKIGASNTGAPASSAQASTEAPAAPSFKFISERAEKTIPLLYPFAIDGVEYKEYTLRRLSAEEVAEVGHELRRTDEYASLYSALTGLPFIACKKMDADDAEAMAAAALDFMPAALRQVLKP